MNSLPPTFTSAIFNTSAFSSGGYLTKAQADLLYLPYSTYNLINAPPGTVVASKAVIVDANKDISSFRNLTAVNLTGTIQTAAQPNITSLNASSLSASGIISFTNTTQSTAYTNGSLILSGGLGIAKNVYTNGSITNNGTINATTIDTLNTSLVYPLTINHLLSSGSPSANNFGIGMTFSGPNASNSTISYGRIYSTCQLSTAGLHQGSLTLSSVIAGNFVDVMTISSLTSSTNNLVSIAGATSVLSVYHTLSTLVTGTIQTAAQPNITSLGTLISPLKTLNSVSNSLGLESTSTTTLTNSSLASDFDLYIKRNISSNGITSGIAFSITGNGTDIAFPCASIIVTRTAYPNADMSLNTSLTERFKIAANGVCSFSLTTASTSSSAGAVSVAGGVSISNTTDATSSTVGGSFTTAGGVAIAKKLYVGTDLTVGSSFISPLLNATISDSGTANIVYPFNIQHLTSSYASISGTNSFGMGMKFQAPNASNTTVDYGAIDCVISGSAAGVQQGQMNFYTVIGGSLVKALTLSSLTSSTNNLLSLAGGTSVFSAYHTLSTLVTGTIQTAAQPNITSLNAATLTASGIITFTNTSVSTTSTSNAVQISGGLYMDKAIRNNSYYNCHTQNNAATSYATSPQAICLRDQAIYFRNQNGGDTNHGLMFSGSGNANWNSSAGFASKSIDGPVLFGNTGVLLGSVQSGTQVAALSCISGNTNIYGTCYINNPPSMPNQSSAVQIKSTGYQMTLAYDATYYTRLSTGGLGSFTIETNTSGGSGGFTSHTFSAGSLGLGLIGGPRFRLDFGNTAADFITALYNANNLEPTYGFGANGSALMYHSAGSNGHKWYINTTGGVGAPNTVGTTVMTLTTSALTIPAGRIFMTVNGYGFSHFSGSGVEVNTYVDGNTAGSVGCYSNHPFYIRTNNSSRLYITAGGLVGIGTNSPSCNLHVNGTTGQTTSSGFGWLSGSGTGTATGFTNRQFSIRTSGGILCDSGEIDVLSDIRVKTNIKKLDDELCDRFINNIDPIEFTYKVNKNAIHYGFSAQQLMEYGFTTLVGFTQDENEELQELIVDCENGDKIKLEKHTRLIVNLMNMIPILMNVIKRQKDQIDNIDEAYSKLNNKLDKFISLFKLK